MLFYRSVGKEVRKKETTRQVAGFKDLTSIPVRTVAPPGYSAFTRCCTPLKILNACPLEEAAWQRLVAYRPQSQLRAMIGSNAYHRPHGTSAAIWMDG